MLHLNDIIEARTRLNGYIRHTPLLKAHPVKQPMGNASELSLKLECLQITGSFKARGAVNKLLNLEPERVARGIVTASGGNHALGVAYAGWLAKTQTLIYLPQSTPPEKVRKLESWGARVVFEGAVWDDANRAAIQAAQQDDLVYIHPFADEAVIAGQGTVGLEILEDEPEIDIVLIAIGGGGLTSGVSLALKSLKSGVKVIGVEPVGAPTLYESLRAGRVIELPEIHTRAGTLAPRQSTALNLEIIQRYVDEIVLVSDDEMLEAARWLWFETGIAAELSGAAALAALLTQKVTPDPEQKVCALVCGAGTDGIS